MYGLVRALNRLAELAWVQGERAEAAAIYDQTIVLSRQLDDKWLIAHSLSKLGRAAYYSGDAVQAISAYEEGLGLWRELGDKARTGGLLVSLGEVARHQGDHERARAYYDESLALWQKLGDTWGIAEVHCCLGYLAYNQGDDTQAAALFASSLAVVGKREDNGLEARLLAARLLAGLGAIAQKQRAPRRAARLLGAARAQFETIDALWDAAERREFDGFVAAVGSQLDQPAFAAAWAEGQAMPLAQGVAYALEDGR